MPYVDDDNYVIFPDKKDIFKSSVEQEEDLGTTINVDGKTHNIAQRGKTGYILS